MAVVTYPSYSGLRQNGTFTETERPFWLTTAPLCKPMPKPKRKTRSDKGKKRGPNKRTSK